MKVTVTLEHWNKARKIDADSHGQSRILYCPIAQALIGMGLPNVTVRGDAIDGYYASYGTETTDIHGCGHEIAKTFDNDELPREDLFPCTFELPDAS